MTASVTHAKTLVQSDDGDTSKVQPSDWNGEHIITGLSGANVVVSDTPPGSPAEGDFWLQIVDGQSGYGHLWLWTVSVENPDGVWEPCGVGAFAQSDDTSGYQEFVSRDGQQAFWHEASDGDGSGTGGFYGNGNFAVDAELIALSTNDGGTYSFETDGLHLGPGAPPHPLIFTYNGDPSSDGYAALTGSLLLATSGTLWIKNGGSDNDWFNIGATTPNLEAVLTEGNSTNGIEIKGSGSEGWPSGLFLSVTNGTDGAEATLHAGAIDGGPGGAVGIVAGTGAAGEVGGTVVIVGGAGDNGAEPNAVIRANGSGVGIPGQIDLDAPRLDVLAAYVQMGNLPTSDPAVLGQLWINLGVLMVSAG